MSHFGILLLVVCGVLVVLPPRFDPAIRIKERNERLIREREHRKSATRA